jgi:hypothetical protein
VSGVYVLQSRPLRLVTDDDAMSPSVGVSVFPRGYRSKHIRTFRHFHLSKHIHETTIFRVTDAAIAHLGSKPQKEIVQLGFAELRKHGVELLSAQLALSQRQGVTCIVKQIYQVGATLGSPLFQFGQKPRCDTASNDGFKKRLPAAAERIGNFRHFAVDRFDS